MSTSIFTRRVFIFIGMTIFLLGCNGFSVAATKTLTEIPASATSTAIPITETFTVVPPTATSTTTPIGLIETYPQIDGQVGENEWENISLKYSLPHGTMYYVNDDRYLYMLID